MNGQKKSFSFYLLVFSLIFLTFIVVWITIGDLVLVNSNFQDNAGLLRNETEQNLIESVATIDSGLKLYDNTLNRQMEEGFVIFQEGYRDAGGDPSRMNLTDLKREIGGGMELYIINGSGIIEYTTYAPELGLNFSESIPYFYEYLMRIRETDGFYPDRVVQERSTGNLRKFAYSPTYDHRYVLELGLSSQSFGSERTALRYTDMIENVRERSPYIRDMRIFTTAKRQVGNRSFEPDPAIGSILDQVLSTRQSLVIPDDDPSTTKKYLYIDLRDEDYAADMSLIVEIIYDDALIIQSQNQLIAFHILVAAVGLMLGIVGAIGVSHYLTRPITQIAEDTDIIARGDLEHRIASTRGSEFEILEKNINSLVHSLKTMILELQLSEGRLKESEERYRDVVESQSEFILRFRPDGTITFANDAYCRYFGMKDCDIEGTRFPPLLPEEMEGGPRERFPDLSRGHPEFTIEYQSAGPGGEPVWQQWSGRAIFGPDGSLAEYQAVGRDVTERRRIEEENRRLNEELEERVRSRTAELEGANRELDSFSYSVSHDLRAPLRAIDGFSMILLHEHASGLPPGTRSYLEKIRENTQRMGILIDDLLNFSRMSRLPLNRFLVDPGSIAREAYDEFRTETMGRQIEISIQEMPACSADPVLLNQVYANLLSNALKFTRTRDVARIEVGSLQSEGKRIYYVKDNGVGFDMKYAGKLFGVFQRLHDDPSIEGTGVGLAIVERIIHRHGGSIWAQSAPGEGTTFFFTLG